MLTLLLLVLLLLLLLLSFRQTSPVPAGSIKMLYSENSFDKFTFNSTVTQWITVTDTETAAAGGNAGLGTRVWTPLKEALRIWGAVEGNNLADYDQNGDGYIDAVTFIHSGMGSEWGGTDGFGKYYTSRIWSHKWAMYDEDFRVDGIRVYSYNISPGTWGLACTAAQCAPNVADGCSATETLPIGRIGVIAHELGHYIGLPDKYDGTGGSGLGSYELMANSWGNDNTQNNPPPFSLQTKIELGWITPTTLTASGNYTVTHPKSRIYQVTPPTAASTNTAANEYGSSFFKIEHGFSNPTSEYFLLEVSRNYGHHKSQPCQGLLLWHVDAGKGYLSSGLDAGETCFPHNLVHNEVALVQADGYHNLERGNNRCVAWTKGRGGWGGGGLSVCLPVLTDHVSPCFCVAPPAFFAHTTYPQRRLVGLLRGFQAVGRLARAPQHAAVPHGRAADGRVPLRHHQHQHGRCCVVHPEPRRWVRR